MTSTFLHLKHRTAVGLGLWLALCSVADAQVIPGPADAGRIKPEEQFPAPDHSRDRNVVIPSEMITTQAGVAPPVVNSNVSIIDTAKISPDDDTPHASKNDSSPNFLPIAAGTASNPLKPTYDKSWHGWMTIDPELTQRLNLDEHPGLEF